jgi:acetylornithine deacetylase/succinyl-diaminopimelate desuccinylase-like protein
MTKLLFDGEKAFKYIEKLAVDIGTRPSGSEAEKEAADWIASEFKALGLKTSIEEFEVHRGKDHHDLRAPKGQEEVVPPAFQVQAPRDDLH